MVSKPVSTFYLQAWISVIQTVLLQTSIKSSDVSNVEAIDVTFIVERAKNNNHSISKRGSRLLNQLSVWPRPTYKLK